MPTVDTLLVEIKADMSQFRRQLASVERQTTRSSSKISGSLKKIGIAAGAYVGVQLVASFARAGVAGLNLASDIQEMTSMSEAVFGEFVGGVREQLDEFAEAVGRSSFELEGMAASIQDTFVPLGFARGEAAKMSVELTKLATDVASFKNASDPAVLNAFSSALVGNHEAVRSFGIVITEASLKQELFRMGIKKSYDEITNQEKVQARLNLLYAGTTDAQGDALRTSDSYANSVRDLRGAGEELINNFFTPILPVATSFIQKMTEAADATSDFLARIGLLDDAAKLNIDLADSLKEIESATTSLNEARAHEKGLIDGSVKAHGDLNVAIIEATGNVHKLENELVDAQTAYLALGGGDQAKNLAISKELLALKTDDLSDAQERLNKLVLRGANWLETTYDAKVVTATEDVASLTTEVNNLNSSIANMAKLEIDSLIKTATDALNSGIKPNTTSDSGTGSTSSKEDKDAIDRFKESITDLSIQNKRLKLEISGASQAQLKYFDISSRLPTLNKEQEQSLKDLIQQHFELSGALEKSVKDAEQFEKSIEKIKSSVDQLTTDISESLADMVMNGKFELDSFSSIFQSFVKQLIAQALQLLIIKPIIDSLTMSLFPGTGMAQGGQIQANHAVLVGENGPEIFQPSSNGKIIDNSMSRMMLNKPENGETVDNSMSRMMSSSPKDDRPIDDFMSRMMLNQPKSDTTISDSKPKMMLSPPKEDTTINDFMSRMMLNQPKNDKSIDNSMPKMVLNQPKTDTSTDNSLPKMMLNQPKEDRPISDFMSRMMLNQPKEDRPIDDFMSKMMLNTPKDDRPIDNSLPKMMLSKPESDTSINDFMSRIMLNQPRNEKIIDNSLPKAMLIPPKEDRPIDDFMSRMMLSTPESDTSIDNSMPKMMLNAPKNDRPIEDFMSRMMLNQPRNEKIIDNSLPKMMLNHPKEDRPIDDFMSKMMLNTPESNAPIDNSMPKMMFNAPKDDRPIEDLMSRMMLNIPKEDAPINDFISKMMLNQPKNDKAIDNSLPKMVLNQPKTDTSIDNSQPKMVLNQPKEDRPISDFMSRMMLNQPGNDKTIDNSMSRTMASPPESGKVIDNSLSKMMLNPPRSDKTIDNSMAEMMLNPPKGMYSSDQQSQGSSVIVNLTQEITFTTDVKSSVKQEILNEMPRINQSAVEAVTSSIKRNGDVKRAIG